MRPPPTPTCSPRCSPRTPTSPSRRPRWSVLPHAARAPSRLVFMDENTLYAARDPQGIRPLVLGRLERGWVVASETAALDIVGASFVREVEPGELHRHRRGRPALAPLRRGRPQGLPLRVRLPRPPRHHDRRPRRARGPRRDRPPAGPRAPGRRRPGDPGARSPARPPRSATPQESGIPFGQGLVKNAYVGRTFIQPSQTIRQLGIRLKLNPLRDVIARQAAGRRRRLDRARQHPARPGPDAARGRRASRCTCGSRRPPVKWPCFYGIDFATPRRADRQRPDASRRSARSIGADSLGYVSLDGLIAATDAAARTGCAAPASTATTRSSCPSPSCSASTCSRASSAAGPCDAERHADARRRHRRCSAAARADALTRP